MKLNKKKNMKTLNFYSKSIVILLFTGLFMNTVAAQTEKKEQVTKVYEMTPTGSLQFTSGSGSNVEILTWDRNEVKIVGELTYGDIDNKEDIDKILNAFKSMDAQSSKDVLKLNLKLIESSMFKSGGLFKKGESLIVLSNGDKITTFSSFGVQNKIETTYTIWIPATLSVKAECKFGKLKIAPIEGNVDLILNHNNLEMRDFGKSGIFEIRFSKVSIGSGGTSKINLYHSEVNTVELKNVTIDARFSKFNIAKAEDVSLISYHDNSAIFGMLDNIDASAKFSTIHIENNMGNAKFDFYHSKLFGENFQTLEISAKFSEFNVANISDTKITSSYHNKFNFVTVNTFSCQESKFDTFKFDEVIANASFPNAYQTKVDIRGTSASFSSFSGNFRFGTVNLKLNPTVVYNLNFDGTFGKLDGVSPDKFKTKFVSDKNNTKTTVQGLNAGAKCNIELVVQNTTCKIE